MTRILVVESDGLMREALQHLLEGEGYEVTCLANGREALQSLEQAPTADLVVTDLLNQGMDGLTFIHTLREARFTMPVLCFTGTSDADTVGRAVALGANAVISKTAEPGLLLYVIAAVASARQLPPICLN